MNASRTSLPELKTPVGPRSGGPRTGIIEIIAEMIAAPAGPAPLGEDSPLPSLKTPVSGAPLPGGGPVMGIGEVILELIASPVTSAERGE